MSGVDGQRGLCAHAYLMILISLGLLLTKPAVVHARSQSFLGHNVLFCAHRYHFSVNICNELSSFDNLVKSFVHNSIDWGAVV